jgi:hypothetical protein
MVYIIKSKYYECCGRLWEVNPSKSGLRTDILKRILEQLNNEISQHRKLFIFRFDLSVLDYTERNELMAVFFRRLSRRVFVYYETDMEYFWVRELEKSKQQHYHCYIILNGSKVNNPYYIQEWIKQIWDLYGRCFWSAYHNLNRKDSIKRQEVTYHLSYLAKVRGKGYRSTQTKDYGHSRI